MWYDERLASLNSIHEERTLHNLHPSPILGRAVCAPVYLFMLPNIDPRPGVSLKDRAKEMDYIGGVLVIGTFISGVMLSPLAVSPTLVTLAK